MATYDHSGKANSIVAFLNKFARPWRGNEPKWVLDQVHNEFFIAFDPSYPQDDPNWQDYDGFCDVLLYAVNNQDAGIRVLEDAAPADIVKLLKALDLSPIGNAELVKKLSRLYNLFPKIK